MAAELKKSNSNFFRWCEKQENTGTKADQVALLMTSTMLGRKITVWGQNEKEWNSDDVAKDDIIITYLGAGMFKPTKVGKYFTAYC